MKKDNLFLLLFFFSVFVFSQPNQEFSLEKEIDKLELDFYREGIENLKNLDKRSLCLYEQSKKENYKQGMIIASKIYTVVMFNSGNLDEASKFIASGIELAKNEEDYKSLASFMATKAKIYNYSGVIDKSKTTIFEGLKIADKIENKDDKHIAKANLYVIFMAHGVQESFPKDSIFYFRGMMLKQAKLISKEHLARDIVLAYAELTFAQEYMYGLNENHQVAINHLKYAEEIALRTKSNTIKAVIYKDLGKVHNFISEFELSAKYYEEAIKYAEASGNKIFLNIINNEYSELLLKLGEEKKANKLLVNSISNSLEIDKSKGKALENILKNEIPVKKEETKHFTTKYYYIIIFSILSFGIFLVYYRIMSKKSQSTKDKNNLEILDLKNDYEVATSNPNSKDIISIDAILELKSIAEKDNKLFLERFRDVFSEHINKLTNTYPDLTLSDIEILAYFRLNYTAKDIARFTNSSVRSIESKKYRLRKKLNLDSEDNLYSWLLNF
ncbi:hypothetical protein M0M57_11235 [Flavobacterium azooxidireducens]|uniref:HTH luxR-type domain-containing protein n=1 Tax=Flavobacterium azooxidireducens TaxID=1871076 RepID=A0ABY4KBM7_9FLAO|nr:hypothetical protein [Flavobacterium azooxidireducens]UPQ78196.1 hypothetical protein M0M57_11235 [Flavobacterium azooxidireducens]